MHLKELAKYRRVQDIARQTIDHLVGFIKIGVSEAEIAKEAERFMCGLGVQRFWYHNVPALVLVGYNTTLSISGREYTPDSVRVQKIDLVSVDLSPEINGYWGDFARTFVVADGKVVPSLPLTHSEELRLFFYGTKTQEALHEELRRIVHPGMACEEVYFRMNALIEELGFVNLDFKMNLGHSIAQRIDDRVYLERGNKTSIGDLGLFTFEPHIWREGGWFGLYGFKKEDIYYFDDGRLQVL